MLTHIMSGGSCTRTQFICVSHVLATWLWCLHMGTLAMVPSHGYTGYGAFTWVHWLWCLHTGTLAMVPSHGYTGYGAFTRVHWLWCLHMGTLAMVPSHGYTGYGENLLFVNTTPPRAAGSYTAKGRKKTKNRARTLLNTR